MSATAHNPAAWVELAALPAPARSTPDPSLAGDLLAHLDRQLMSVRGMRKIVFAQAAAIRRRAVREVVVTAGELQVEMHRRELLERERLALMQRAAAQLAAAPESIGFTSVQRLLDPESAAEAAARTAELTRLLIEIDREHKLNRKLLAQELSFLDHLLGLADGTGGYAARPHGTGTGPVRAANGTAVGGQHRIMRNVPATRRRVFDLEA